MKNAKAIRSTGEVLGSVHGVILNDFLEKDETSLLNFWKCGLRWRNKIN